MKLRHLSLLAALAVLAGCGGSRGIQNEAAIRQGVIDYLSKRTDLSLSAMQVDVTAVSFRQNEADATVSFRPKGAAAGTGMSMHYVLERQGGRWVVKGHGRGPAGAAPHSAGQMPQGGMPPAGEGASKLPPGHPPMGR